MKNSIISKSRVQRITGTGQIIFTSLMLFFVVVYGCFSVVQAQANQEDFFYSDGQQNPVIISLDQIGILAKEEIADSLIRGFIFSLELEIVREFRGGLFIAGLKDSLDRAQLLQFTRQVKSQGGQLLKQVGMVLTSAEFQDPFILIDEFIAQFNSEATKEQIEAFNNENAVQILMENPFVKNQYLLRVSEISRTDALEIANRYHMSNLTVSAYPNFLGVFYDNETLPNDPLFGDQWHHRNTTQGGGTNDADADLSMAWDITMGDAGILIAVLENGGFDMNHPDLTPNLWVNPGEVAGNGLDDDNNGFDDDLHGWDFNGNDNDPAPGAGEHHGTAVAGVAGARGNNLLGVSGSCPICRLMFLRTGYVNSDFNKSLAFGYAQNNGAQIITNSWGGGGAMPNTVTAINNATAAGVIVLFAAGNNNLNVCSGENLDPRVSNPNVIAVSSSTNLDRKARGGTFEGCSIGNCIDILAPSFHGDIGTIGITTTDVQGNAGYNNNAPLSGPLVEPSPPPADARDYTLNFNGTSSATPLTAGVVGLILSVNPGLTRVQVQRLLQDTADKIEDSEGDYDDDTGFSSPVTGVATHSWGRLSAFEAVRIAAPVADGGKAGVDIFLRDNRLDWGNTEQPSYTLFESPRGFIGHYRSMDIKVDAPPYQPTPTAATFDTFTDETPSAILGDINRVYVRVRNRGPVTASTVTVKLHWTQFGTALPALPSDFWTAFPANSTNTTQWHPLNCSGTSSPTCTITNLNYSGSSVAGGVTDAAQIVKFDFPYPAVDPSLPNHFCLLAMIDSPQDRILPKSRPTIAADFIVDELTPNDNNVTHRNYHNLNTNLTSIFAERFFARNPYEQAIRALLRFDAPPGWIIRLDSLKFHEPFTLEPNEEILVTMTAILPELNLSGDVSIIQERVDIQPATVMGGVTYQFRGVEAPSFAPSEGILSACLIGTYDLRNGGNTILHILNPTAKVLRVNVAFYDDNEKPITCIHDSLTPDDLLEIDVRNQVNVPPFGVVKIVSMDEYKNVPVVGITGYQRHFFTGTCFFIFKKKYGVTEAALQPVPTLIITKDSVYQCPVCRK